MRNRWLAFGLLIAMGALLMGAAACKSSSSSGTKKTSTPVKTPSAATHTPSSGATPAATAGSPSAQSTVNVTLVEYRVVPLPTSVLAGTVTFNAKNIGTTQHTLVVVKTDAAPNALPAKADGSYDDTAAGASVIGQVQPIGPNGSDRLTVNLVAGHYVLICNIIQTTNGRTVSHYNSGMTTGFTVTQ